jgi:ATP-dependent Lon protease
MSTSTKSRGPEPSTCLPLLPLKEVVIFPGMVVPLLVGRPASLSAVDDSLASGRPLLLCTQRDPAVESPAKKDLYDVGVTANVVQTMRMPDGTMKVVVEGLNRMRVKRLRKAEACLEAVGEEAREQGLKGDEGLALMRMALGQFDSYVRLSGRVAPDIVASLNNVEEGGALADLICGFLPLRVEERQSLLETIPAAERLETLSSVLVRETELLEIEQQVRDRIREQMDRGQREHYLHEQLKVIRSELGNRDEFADESAELRELVEKAKMPAEANEKALREIARFERMPPMSPEGAVIRGYVEWLTDMPWKKRTRHALDIDKAKAILDEDHYGLDKVKERILEFLAVLKLNKKSKGPILCLVGPPGVGKTSLGKSVARAMGRKFVRVSLGGIRDEAEIRGHRRTYIGSLPGRIIQSLKKAEVKNPVFMLDEIDKMSMDFRGDPSSALLEVLDPEQNSAFSDHYLEVSFDLSEVFFITTANSEYEIPAPLHDRMEVVRLSGYTPFEKEHIARLFLVPKQIQESGLDASTLHFTRNALYKLIQRYTREAGVRELERRIANVCRKEARNLVSKGGKRPGKRNINEKRVVELLGPEEYREEKADLEPQSGVAVGLAWTWTGGDILTIETTTMRGKGELTLTGQLGDVMKESAHAAFTYIRAHAKELGVSPNFYKDLDLHVHVPEGAIPKDGPSAGVTIAVSMLSALRDTPPARLLAMTGEITLRGRVLAVGGVKEKMLAAHRAGIRNILLPQDNEKDLQEVPKEILKDLAITFVSGVDEVINAALPPAPRAARKRKPAARTRKK